MPSDVPGSTATPRVVVSGSMLCRSRCACGVASTWKVTICAPAATQTGTCSSGFATIRCRSTTKREHSARTSDGAAVVAITRRVLASWHINRRTLQGRDALVALCDTVRKVFPNGLDREVRCTLAEGDRVAIQHVNRAVTGQGQDYVNEYMKLFEFDPDGRIRAVWEYLDSRYAAEMLAPGT